MYAEADMTCPVCGIKSSFSYSKDSPYVTFAFHNNEMPHIHLMLYDGCYTLKSEVVKTKSPKETHEIFMSHYGYFPVDHIDELSILISWKAYRGHISTLLLVVGVLKEKPKEEDIREMTHALKKIKSFDYLKKILSSLERDSINFLSVKFPLVSLSGIPLMISVAGVYIIENRDVNEKIQQYSFGNDQVFVVPVKHILDFTESSFDFVFSKKLPTLTEIVDNFNRISLMQSILLSAMFLLLGVTLIFIKTFMNMPLLFLSYSLFFPLEYKIVKGSKKLNQESQTIYDLLFEKTEISSSAKTIVDEDPLDLEKDILYEEIISLTNKLSVMLIKGRKEILLQHFSSLIKLLKQYLSLQYNVSLEDSKSLQKLIEALYKDIKVPKTLLLNLMSIDEDVSQKATFLLRLPMTIKVLNRLLVSIGSKTLLPEPNLSIFSKQNKKLVIKEVAEPLKLKKTSEVPEITKEEVIKDKSRSSDEISSLIKELLSSDTTES